MNGIDEVLQEFNDVCLKKRAFFDCRLFEMLKNSFKDVEYTFRKGEITYRARAYKDPNYGIYTRFLIYTHEADEKDVEDNPGIEIGERIGFWGYNEKDSFVNLNKYAVEEGRCNYRYNPCLYTADNERVAISEIKPLVREVVSVAKIKNKEDLRLVDLRLNKDNEFINAIAKFFVQSPTLENPDAYIYTQAISAFVRSCGYDGLVYSSCQVIGGINYVIFNYDKCEAISSELYTVNNLLVCFSKM